MVHTERTVDNPRTNFSIEFSGAKEAIEILEALAEHFYFPLGKNYELEQLRKVSYDRFKKACETYIDTGHKPKINVI